MKCWAEACPEVPISPPALTGLWHQDRALPSSCSKRGQVVWSRFFSPSTPFCVCASCLNLVAVFGGNQKNRTVQVVREDPQVWAQSVWWSSLNTDHHCALPRAEEKEIGAQTLDLECSSSVPRLLQGKPQPARRAQRRGQQTFWSRHVSSPRESITFRKEMLTIKCVH